MTSPAVLVLCLTLVCSTMGETSKQTADHDSKHKSMHNIMEPIDGLVKEVNNQNLNMKSRTNVYNHRVNDVNSIKYETNSYGARENEIVDNFVKYDEIYKEDEDVLERDITKNNDYVDKLRNSNKNSFITNFIPKKKRVKREDKHDKCSSFYFEKDKAYISHPHIGDKEDVNYSSNTYCTTVISGQENQVVQLTFVDMFHIEDHPECSYDYLEIRDGNKGYFNLLDKLCGETFPRQITTSGPHAWLKFYSDDTIEYEGFRIQIAFLSVPNSVSIPESCYKVLEGKYGRIESDYMDKDCKEKSANQALDFLWRIDVPEGHKIYLNFTTYSVAQPNECEENFVQVFGSVLEFDEKLVHYCGSVANPVTTKDSSKDSDSADQGNVMHVRLYAARSGVVKINATFTAFRTLNPNNNEKCVEDTEFDCEDNTCIAIDLKCNDYANCRLKADEEPDKCLHTTESMIHQTHIKVILIIFCLILSGMSFVFFFKCIRKLYQDHKIIKEHIRQSCEDRLDSMVSSRLTLDAKRLQRDSEPRASLERDNQTNEMFKQQRKYSQQKIRPTSIDSDYIQETHLDLDDEPWRREVEDIPKTEDVRIERNGRTRRSDLSKKEESIRRKESEEKKVREIRDVSVGAPDTKESGCQTRESLFQTDPAVSSDGSGTTNSRGFSTFGYSGATIARPSPPQTNTSQITIELIRQATEREEKPQKKFPDRRPMSTETTRSAPDVIIVSKPLR
ncbi:uncharacterized protein LOC112042994 [Bicyclus anynana]|uniref:Uncharacterized protein LOC112042994 n=1 Tax=Bicyclus anynana TaxID=110368 RepID=A0ABM3LYC6_BICAN|nr:uncharacterized protein LOC112042994 [Bicyclus anynana]